MSGSRPWTGPDRPSLIIAGTARAATTSLFFALARHPDVHASPVKEPRYFSRRGRTERCTGPGDEAAEAQVVRDTDAYRALFASPGATHRMEASSEYLYVDGAIPAIAAAVSDAHVVVVLRDPVARAHSAWLHQRRDGHEPCDRFADALAAEADRIERGWDPIWHYRAMSSYGAQLARADEHLARGRLHVVGYERLVERPDDVVAELVGALGLAPIGLGGLAVRHNASGFPRSARLHRALSAPSPRRQRLRRALPASVHRAVVRARNANLERTPPIDRDVARVLRRSLDDDVAAVSELAGPDLTVAWTTGTEP